MWVWLVNSGQGLYNWVTSSIGQVGAWTLTSLNDACVTVQHMGQLMK